jgi:16S rRNA (uracil1498-N3)-methyltransferase
LSEHPKTRLYVESDLADGISVGLDAARAHFLKSVLRLPVGARLALFNGRDGEFLARIDGFGKGWCSVATEARLRPQAAEPDLWLVFAPVKRARIDFIAEKATELGVSALAPVYTERTVVDRVNVARLRANAVEAAEQTERLSVPRVDEPRPLGQLVADWPAERRLLVCDETGAAPSIADALAAPSAGPWAILVGPEGGFAPRELDGLRNLPFVTAAGLGPRVLRSDTAALAALAVFQALAGDWRRSGSR